MTGFFSDGIVGQLNAPLSAAHVKTRPQAGRKLSYLEAWHVIAEANRIFGFDGWNREMAECRCVAERETKMGQPFDDAGNPLKQRDGWRVGYVARVRITVGPVVREGCGYGSGIDADLGSAHESALKEAESDAMKRALMTFGNQFGLALYDKAQSNVEAPTRPAVAPARPTNAPTQPATSATPSSTGKAKKPPKWDYAGARFREIENALKGAETEKLANEIWDVNEKDLDLIAELHGPSYQRLVTLRDEVLAKLSPRPDAFMDRTDAETILQN